MTMTFEQTLRAIGLQEADIEAAGALSHATGLERAAGDAPVGLWVHYITVETAEDLRRALNPLDVDYGVPAAEGAPAAVVGASRGGTWGEALGRTADDARARVLAAARHAALGPASAAVAHASLEDSGLFPTRVGVVGARSLVVAAGTVLVLPPDPDPTTPFHAVFDTVTIEAGGQLVLAAPMNLTIRLLNRVAAQGAT